jgi:hypothetical protein
VSEVGRIYCELGDFSECYPGVVSFAGVIILQRDGLVDYGWIGRIVWLCLGGAS